MWTEGVNRVPPRAQRHSIFHALSQVPDVLLLLFPSHQEPLTPLTPPEQQVELPVAQELCWRQAEQLQPQLHLVQDRGGGRRSSRSRGGRLLRLLLVKAGAVLGLLRHDVIDDKVIGRLRDTLGMGGCRITVGASRDQHTHIGVQHQATGAGRLESATNTKNAIKPKPPPPSPIGLLKIYLKCIE